MISIYFRSGERTLKSNDLEHLLLGPDNALVWVDLNNPEADEKRRVEEGLGITLLDKQKSEEIEISSRYVELDDRIIINSSFQVYTPDEDEYEFETVSFTLKNGLLISSRAANLKAFAESVRKFKVNQGLFGDGFSCLIALFETRVDQDADLLEYLSRRTSQMSNDLDLENPQVEARSLIDAAALQEVTMRLRENIIDNQRVISSMLRSERFPDAAKAKLRILIKDINSLLDHTAFTFERLEYVQNTLMGLINLEQNKIIKIFTVVTVIFMPPTLIASIYGMNFRAMPELDWSLGYPLAILLMIGSSAITLWFFRRNKWL